MNWCVWAEVPDRPGYFDCLHCKLPLGHPRGQRAPREYPEKVRRQCITIEGSAANPDVKPPSAIARARNYLSAREKWVAAGKPLRDDHERATLLAICQGCEHYDPKPIAPGFAGGKCKVCRCGLAKERNTLNKIAWATEMCPRGHWSASDKRHPDPDDGRAV